MNKSKPKPGRPLQRLAAETTPVGFHRLADREGRMPDLAGRPRITRQLWAASALLTACLTVTLPGCVCKREASENGNTTTQPAGGESEANLAKISQALAATENIEPENAAILWAELSGDFPDDPSIKLNTALNAVLLVDTLTSTATDGSRSEDEKKAARAKLPDAIDAARRSIQAYNELSGDQITELWLDCRIDAHEATLLGATISKSLRRDLFKKLTDAIGGPLGDDPKSIILGGPLVDLLEKMVDPVDGLAEQYLTPATESLRRLSDANEDNLFLALQALRLSLEARDKAVVDLVDRTWELAKAVEPTLAAYTKPIGLTPEELAGQIRQAVDAEDWAKADQSSVLWSNVLNPLEILRTDRRRTSPHPLDRLSFDTIRRLSSEIVERNPIAPLDSPLEFTGQSIDQKSRAIIAVDADLDLKPDLVSLSDDGKLVLLQKMGESSWSVSAELQLEKIPDGIMAADLFMVDSSHSDRIERSASAAADGQQDYSLKSRHDTLPGLVLYGGSGIQLVQIDTRESTPAESRMTLVSKTTGLEGLPPIGAVTTGDLEGDGDLDLIVAPSEGAIRTFVNRGNRTFFEAAVGTSTVDADDPVADMAIADLDRDIDLDIVTIHRSGRIGILENLLHLQFRFRYLDEVPRLPIGNGDETLSVAVEDVDSNVGWDIIAASSEQSLVSFGNSSDIGVWTTDRTETGPGLAGVPQLADFDNDSYLELLAAGTRLVLGPWGINVADEQTAILKDALAVDHADLDGDGAIDLIAAGTDSVRLGRNSASADAHRISVRFKGINDNAAASGRVNHYAIGSVLELRFGPYLRSRIVNGPETHFGMDGIEQADSIRVIMPNGLTQTIRDPKIDSVIEEEQTLKGSCPYLYTWDGNQFRFVTDCLWAAPLGLQVASGVVQRDRPWEYLKIDGDFVRKNSDGHYEFRLTEELWEVAYVDKIRLVAVDHPAEVDVYSNEKVGPPEIATPTIYSFAPEDLHAPVTARDTDGNDIAELLRESDERYVQGFDRRIRQGLCPPHWIDLEFGREAKTQMAEARESEESRRSAYLVLRGWILPTDTSLNIQIDQNPELPPIEFPSVWVPDETAASGWKKAIPFMGFPGGKTKTIVVDVTDHLIADDPRVRVRTSAQIYWDSAALAIQDSGRDFQTHQVPLIAAEVAYHGFSQKKKLGPATPETYRYSRADLKPKWPPLRGAVTRFGDCIELLKEWDDSMVVISGGDEIRMRFAAPKDDPPAGWKRDFILHCVGWDKDADLNTLTGQSIGPLPIREMRSYPPTAASREAFEDVKQKNADSLRRRQSFRGFWQRRGSGEKPFLTVPEAG